MTTGALARQAAETAVERGYAFRLVVLFGVGWLVLTTDAMILNPLLPLIREDFQLSGTQAGLLSTALFVPYLLMQIPAGMLADRFGPKQVLVVLTLVAGLAFGGIGLFGFSLVALVVFGAVHRASAGVYYSSAFGITLNAVPRALRGVSSAALSGGMALGSGVAMAVAVPLALFGGSWRFPYSVMAVLTVLLALAILGTVRSGQRVGASRGAGLGPALRDRQIWLVFSLCACSNFSFTALSTWVPSFLNSERGLPLALAGLYAAVISIVGFPAGFLMGRISDRVGRRRLTVGLFVAGALSIVAMATLQQPGWILAALAAYGLTGKWGSDGPVIAWVGDHISARYATASGSLFGANNTFRMGGALVAPVVAGALLDLTGSLQAGLYVAAVSLVLGAILALLAEDARKPEYLTSA